MPVRFEEPRPPTEPRPAGVSTSRQHRPRWIVIAAIVAVLVLAGVGIAVLVSGDGDGSKPAGAGDGTSSTSSKTLPRGSVTFGEGGRGDLFGLPIKYPRTEDGGAAAAINESVVSSGPLWVSEPTRVPLDRYVLTAHARSAGLATTAAQAAKEREKEGLDEDGQVVDDDGTVDPNGYYLGATIIPEYGAYRVVSSTEARVVVDLWGPLVTGTVRGDGSGTSSVRWVQSRVTVAWDRGDWRLYDITVAPGRSTPQPANTAALNVSFAERASLLPASAGWVVVKNATQTTRAYPDGLKKP